MGQVAEPVRQPRARSRLTMGAQGATLQNYNNELVKCIEDLREKREEVNRAILKEEEEKAKIQKDLSILTDRSRRSTSRSRDGCRRATSTTRRSRRRRPRT